jgi:hypothetical protein
MEVETNFKTNRHFYGTPKLTYDSIKTNKTATVTLGL